MSKLTDIKNRIDQMDGGAFQNLCDAYLSYKGYKNIYSLGMHTGTDKTAKGNPDTYFLTAENKYVFVTVSYTHLKTVILVLHEINYAAFYSDYICAFVDGKIAKFGTVKEVMTKETLSQIYRVDFEIMEISGKPLSIYY